MEARRLVLWALGAVVFAASASAAALYARQGFSPSRAVAADQAVLNEKLRDGDLIFRRGHDVASRTVLAADGTSPFSHVGLVVKRNGFVYVIHAVPPERPDRNDGVVMDALAFFSDPERADVIAVYRINSLDSIKAINVTQIAESMLGRPFEDKFDLSEQNRLYCTELVWVVFRSQGIILVSAPEVLHVPFLGEKFILPRTLLSSGLLSRVTL